MPARCIASTANKIPGFIVMAEDKDEGARILAQGFEQAIVDASNDKASVLSNDDRPWILLRPNGISLARMERYPRHQRARRVHPRGCGADARI